MDTVEVVFTTSAVFLSENNRIYQPRNKNPLKRIKTMKTKNFRKMIIAMIVAILAMFVAVSVEDGSKGEIAIRAIFSILFVAAILFYNEIDKEDKQ